MGPSAHRPRVSEVISTEHMDPFTANWVHSRYGIHESVRDIA
jgi:hypothetical protein